MWALLRLPRFRGATHADDHDNRSRHRQVGVPGSRSYAAGEVVIRRQLKRRSVLAFFQKLPPCLVGIEACPSSHHWSRELQALGHTVRLMPPAYVKPDVKRQKNDAADAEAICEAVTRANMCGLWHFSEVRWDRLDGCLPRNSRRGTGKWLSR